MFQRAEDPTRSVWHSDQENALMSAMPSDEERAILIPSDRVTFSLSVRRSIALVSLTALFVSVLALQHSDLFSSGSSSRWSVRKTNDTAILEAVSLMTGSVSSPEPSFIGLAAALAATCSWEGTDCTATKCCKRMGFLCFEKHQTWASCSQNCSMLQSVDPSHEPWTCKVLGGSRGGGLIPPAPAPLPQAGVSLFCFMVICPAGVVPVGVQAGYEQALVGTMRAQNIGIFACDANAVFNGARVSQGDWKSIVNTDVFINAWQQVKSNGLFLQHDWTVKVDADAVFFPDRLRQHLQRLQPPANTAMYLHNINFKWNFMGALEVLSKQAVNVLLAGIEECAAHLGHNGGEDFFIHSCLDSLGVGHMRDFTLLSDKYASMDVLDFWVIDPCVRGDVVALHPYKAVNSWNVCHKVSAGVVPIGNVVNCDDRWHGEACSRTSGKRHIPGVSPDGGSGIL